MEPEFNKKSPGGFFTDKLKQIKVILTIQISASATNNYLLLVT